MGEGSLPQIKIEIKGFWETSFLDWPGKIASVLFLPSCNFRCPYCHNHPLVLRPQEIPSIPLEHILSRLSEFRGWIDGVVVTGGEPTLQPELSALLALFQGMDLAVKLHTNGSQTARLKELIAARLVDCIAMDIKASLDPQRYRRAIGREPDLISLRESIQMLLACGLPCEFHTTAVPSLHPREEILAIAREIRGGRLILHNFNPQDPLDPRLIGESPYLLEELEALAKEVEGEGEVESCRVIS